MLLRERERLVRSRGYAGSGYSATIERHTDQPESDGGSEREGERATIESILLRACKRAAIRKKRVVVRMSVDRETSDREKETNVSAVRETGRWGEERERERVVEMVKK